MRNELDFRRKRASTSSFHAHAFFLTRSRKSSAFGKQVSQKGCFEVRWLMRSISLCTTFRHRHFGLSSLIEIAEVEEGNAEMGERKKQRVKRRIEPSDARAAHVADCFWFLCLFARPGNHVCPALARVRGKRQRKRADEAGKQAIRLLHPKETAVGLSWTDEQKNAAGQPTLLAGYTSDSRRGPSAARPDL